MLLTLLILNDSTMLGESWPSCSGSELNANSESQPCSEDDDASEM